MSYGMLCSGEEMNLNKDWYPGADVNGIMILAEDAPLGMEMRDYYYHASFLYRNAYNFVVPWDLVVEFMEKAKELGHDDCDIPLAAFYYERDGRNASKGYEIIKKLADEGHEFALSVLAALYYLGYTVDKDRELAYKILSKINTYELHYPTKYGYVVKDFEALLIMMRDGL